MSYVMQKYSTYSTEEANFALLCTINPPIQFKVQFTALVTVARLYWPGTLHNLIRSWLPNKAPCFS